MTITKGETLEDINNTLSKIKEELKQMERNISDSGRMFIHAEELQSAVSMLFYEIGSIDAFDYGKENQI